MTTPAWQAPISGAQNNLNAVDASAHMNQFLSTHVIAQIGYGNPVVRPTSGDQSYFTLAPIRNSDYGQQFTMSGTSIGRITIPIKTFGNGADVLFSLCPDTGSNTPNTAAPICQAKVPASVLNATGAQLGLENATLPWQEAYNNTYFATNFSQLIPWLSPAASVNGAPSFFASYTSGNYSLLLGGYDTTAGAASALCFTVQYTGAGTVAAPIPQPSLPQATFQAAAAATSDTVVYMGGTTPSVTALSNVWSASWDPSTGIIGAWSSQAALPAATTNAGAAAWGETVYYVGGNTNNTIASGTGSVYYATVSNNQISSWQKGPSLPRGLSLPFVAAVNGWLIVAGGVDTSNTARVETWYSQIRSDGSLGNWQLGPSLFQGVGAGIATWCLGVFTDAVVIYAGTVTGGGLGSYVSVLTVTEQGPAPSWNVFGADSAGTRAMSAFTDGDGIWYLMGYNTNNTVNQNFFQAVPVVSVPLYATGLTNGAKYWVVVQIVITESDSDYTGLGLVNNAYSFPTQYSPHLQNTWSTYTGSYAVPLVVYDTTLTQPIVHTVEDLVSGNQSNLYEKWTTLSYGSNNVLNGIIEVTMQPNNALNSNPTFTTTTSPWTVTGGTLTRSNAQTHGGFPFSGLITPTGGVQAYASTELAPVQLFSTYGTFDFLMGTGWFYSPTGYSTFSLNINWFDSGQNYLSTTFNVVSLTANTWTQVTTFGQVPSTAAYADLSPMEQGTPTASNLLYISDAYMTLVTPDVGTLTSIAQINYQTGTNWPPVGVTQFN